MKNKKNKKENKNFIFTSNGTNPSPSNFNLYMEDGVAHQIPYNNLYVPNLRPNQEWIDFNTVDNLDYPKELLRLYNNSPMHGGIIDRKVDFAIDDIIYESDEQKQKIRKLTRNPKKLFRALAKDYVLFNGFCLLVTYSKDWTKQVQIEWLDFSKVRAEECDENMNINNYYYAWDFREVNLRQSKPIKYSVFNPNDAKNNAEKYKRLINKKGKEAIEELKEFTKKSTKQLFYFKGYNPDNFYYPQPDYVRCIDDIINLKAITRAGTSELKNGFNSSVAIEVVAQSIEELDEAKKTIGKIQNDYIGCQQTGKPFVYIRPQAEMGTKNKDSGVKISTIDNKNSNYDKYKNIRDDARENILQGHSINHPLLAGIQVSGKLGGSGDELKTAWKIYERGVIKAITETIEDEFNYIISYIEGVSEIEIKRQELFTEEDPKPEQKQ